MAFFSLLIFILCFALLDVLWWRAADRRLRLLPMARAWRIALALFMGMLIAYLVVLLGWNWVLRSSNGPVPMSVHAVVYLWHFLALPIVTIYLFAGAAIRSVDRFYKNRKTGNTTRKQQPEAKMLLDGDVFSKQSRQRLTRRQVMAAVAVGVPPVATVVAGAYSVATMYGRRLRHFDLLVPNLPPALNGLTIAHVSDTHIGKFLHPDRLPAIAADINKLDADFIVFTGDLIDLALDDLKYGIDFLHQLKSRCGMAVCEGNHDLMQDRGDFENRMRAADLPLIVGNQLSLPFTRGGDHPVQFLGVPWNMTDAGMIDAVKFLQPAINPDAFPILLAHHPHYFDGVANLNIPLVLSGHTHGGQLMLTHQFGAGSLRFRYTSGLYQKYGSQLIVNNGLGNWFPLRVNAPAELVHITLKRLS